MTTTTYVHKWLQSNYYVHYMFWLGIQMSFNQSTYRHEHKGTPCVVLVFSEPLPYNITVKVTIGAVIGKLCKLCS